MILRGLVAPFDECAADVVVRCTVGESSQSSLETHAFMFTTEYCIRLFVVVLLAAPALTAPKIALVALLLRLLMRQRTAPWQNRGHIILGWVCVALSFAFACVSVVVAGLECSAVDGTDWMPRMECSHAMSVMGIVGGALLVVVNLGVVVMGWRLVVGERKGEWRRRKKQLVVLGLGALP